MGDKFPRIHGTNFHGSIARVMTNFHGSIVYPEIDRIKIDRQETPGSP